MLGRQFLQLLQIDASDTRLQWENFPQQTEDLGKGEIRLIVENGQLEGKEITLKHVCDMIQAIRRTFAPYAYLEDTKMGQELITRQNALIDRVSSLYAASLRETFL